MKMYRFRADAKDQIDRAGVTQAAIARGAAYDRHVLNRKIAHQANVRPATANRIARAFGQYANLSQDAALAILFEEISITR
jgi:plasmid maintenance system antidote protein VapI